MQTDSESELYDPEISEKNTLRVPQSSIKHSNSASDPSISSISQSERKHSRKWTKNQVESLYKFTLEYCNLNNKQAKDLTLEDFSFIAEGRPQSANDCLMKFFEVNTSGSLKSGVWAEIEDNLLTELALKKKSWAEISKKINSTIHENLNIRTGKQCKERWNNHLNNDIRRGPWTDVEDIIILEIYKETPKNWRKICSGLPDRTESAVKNRIKSLVNTATHDLNCFGDLDKGIENLIEKKRKKAQELLDRTLQIRSERQKKEQEKN